MGARFSEMQDDDREVLAAEFLRVLTCLGDLMDPVDFEQYGMRASFIIANVYSSVENGRYNEDALFVVEPTLEGVRDVELFISPKNNERLISLFGEEISGHIRRDVLRLWMELLLNNILTDEDATSERVEECRWMLSREIVRCVCEGAIADEQE